MTDKAGWQVPDGTKPLVQTVGKALPTHLSQGDIVALAVLRFSEELAAEPTMSTESREAIMADARLLRRIMAREGIQLNNGVILVSNSFDDRSKLEFLHQFADCVRTTPAFSHLRVGEPAGKIIRVLRGVVSMPFSTGFVSGDRFRSEFFVDMRDPAENDARYAALRERQDALQQLFGEEYRLVWEEPWGDTHAFRIAVYFDLKAGTFTPDSLLDTALDLQLRFDRTFGGLIPPGRRRQPVR